MDYYFIDYENVKNLGLEGIDGLSENDTVIIFYSQNANTITFETHKKLLASKANIIFEKVNIGYKNALDFQLASYLGYFIGKTGEYEATYNLVTNDAALSVISRFWSRKGVVFSVIERIADKTENAFLAPEIPETAVKKKDPAEEQPSTDIALEETAAAVEKTAYEAPAITLENEEEIVKITEVTLVDEPKKKKPAKKAKAKDKEVTDPELEMKLEAVLDNKEEIPVIVKIIKQYKTKQGINNALMKQFPSQNNQRSGEIYQAIKPLLTDKKGK
ncbi:MAG: hypothetical protein IJ062_04300 [Firmicutes bacterium]|nr:hypothetical protein [Bacillota bacterium]